VTRVGRVSARPWWCSVAVLCGLFLLLINVIAQAGSATWKLNPGSSDWDTATNWTPETVPYGETDIATFGVSNATNITVGAAPNGEDATNKVGEIVFEPDASAYTITLTPVFVVFPTVLTFYGAGITNNSGVIQNFVATSSDGEKRETVIYFYNSASAGENTVITNEGGASASRHTACHSERSRGMERAGASDIDGCAARVAARESGDERVNLWT
jgi:hypothetical protein